MTTLEQIECRSCGEVFHKPTLPEFRIGAAGDFDPEKTCPHCGEKNVDVVTIKGSVPPRRDSPYTTYDDIVTGGESYLRDAMRRGRSSSEPLAKKLLK